MAKYDEAASVLFALPISMENNNGTSKDKKGPEIGA